MPYFCSICETGDIVMMASGSSDGIIKVFQVWDCIIINNQLQNDTILCTLFSVLLYYKQS